MFKGESNIQILKFENATKLMFRPDPTTKPMAPTDYLFKTKLAIYRLSPKNGIELWHVIVRYTMKAMQLFKSRLA
jgi:hypothetical protein